MGSPSSASTCAQKRVNRDKLSRYRKIVRPSFSGTESDSSTVRKNHRKFNEALIQLPGDFISCEENYSHDNWLAAIKFHICIPAVK